MSSTEPLLVGDVDAELLLRQVTDLVLNNRLLVGRATLADKIVDFKHPHELQEGLSLDGSKSSHSEVLNLCRKAVESSVRTNHPMFLNQLYHGADPVGLAGTWLTEALNTNQHTFEVAPFFTLVEHSVLAHLRRFIGWSDGDGIFSPGGSMSNMYGLVVARFQRWPQTKTGGWSALVAGERPVVLTSDQSHYSITKAAHWSGLGTDQVISVTTDQTGRMRPEMLERCIRECIDNGRTPFFLNATCGTTVLGAYDPLAELADICARYNIWLHVDAAWGGGALVSKKHRHLLDGIERADSVAWNPHKMLGAPLQCASFLTRHGTDLLKACNSASASYLFQQDKFYDVSFDTGDKSFQCGRKVDAFKLWLMWKARGDQGMEQLVDNAFDCARYFADRINRDECFRMVTDPQCTNVCFWYVPARMRAAPVEDEDWWTQLSAVAPVIKERMVREGTMMIGYQPLANKKLVNFFRLVVPSQPEPTHRDMDFIVDEFHRLGRDL